MLLQKKEALQGPVLVKVFNGESRACPGVIISMTDQNQQVFKAQSDITGKALISELPFGSYRVHMEKRGYESLDFSIELKNTDQAVYGKLYSREQLLDKARLALKDQHWEECLHFLDRVEAIGILPDWEHLFLKSILYWKQGHWKDAIALLEAQDMEQLPAEILVFYADLQQFEAQNPEAAAAPLSRALEKEYREEWKIRLDQIRENPTREEDADE